MKISFYGTQLIGFVFNLNLNLIVSINDFLELNFIDTRRFFSFGSFSMEFSENKNENTDTHLILIIDCFLLCFGIKSEKENSVEKLPKLHAVQQQKLARMNDCSKLSQRIELKVENNMGRLGACKGAWSNVMQIYV